MLVLDRPSRPFLQSFTAVAFEEVVLVDSKSVAAPPPCCGLVPRKQLEERFRSQKQGSGSRWCSRASQVLSSVENEQVRSDAHREQRDSSRWQSCRHAYKPFEGAEVSFGTRRTLDRLRDPVRRPFELREPLPHTVSSARPAQAFIFDDDLFFTSRRGVAPSGMNVV